MTHGPKIIDYLAKNLQFIDLISNYLKKQRVYQQKTKKYGYSNYRRGKGECPY